MKPVRRINRHVYIYGTRVARAIVVLGFALLLLSASHSPVAAKSGRELSFEDRAAAEKASRSSYRKLEVASLVVIFIAGAGAIYWVIHKRKP